MNSVGAGGCIPPLIHKEIEVVVFPLVLEGNKRQRIVDMLLPSQLESRLEAACRRSRSVAETTSVAGAA